MGRYKGYGEYRESGVEWLGSIPSHWEVFSLKRSVEGCTNGIWGSEPTGNNDLAVIRVADFERNSNRVGLGKLTYRSVTESEYLPRALRKGDLLIEKSGGGEKTLVGCVVLFEHDFKAVTSNFVARMRPRDLFNSSFLCYCFDSLYQKRVNYPSVKQTTGIQNLDSEAYLQERFCFPSFDEQTQIAKFLDHETAKIDMLISKQERLIELLQEKRQAVISHAVTKGLDASVPMKDSGVEWLGEVPEHWGICSLSKIFTIKAGGDVQQRLFSEVKTEEHKYPIYTNSNKENAIYGYSKEANYPADSITVSGRGEVGFAVYRDHEFEAIIRLLVLTPQKACEAKFFTYLINEVLEFREESSAVGQLSTLQIAPYKTVLPPLEEQIQITEYLDRESKRVANLIEKQRLQIELLKERRTALISAAVTGKIDVRDVELS